MKHHRFVAIGGLALAATLPFAAQAQAPANYSVNVDADDYNDTSPPTVQKGSGPAPQSFSAAAGGNTASGYANAVNGGTVQASAQSQFNGVAAGTSILTFSVTLVGPPSTTGAIPVGVEAIGYTNVSGTTSGDLYSSANAYAGFVITYDSALLSAYATSTYNGLLQPTLNFDQTVGMLPGDHFDVSMQVTVAAGGGGDLPSFAEGFIDPVFTLDPSYASLYHLEGIPSPVPEPGCAGLLLAGLGFVGCARRRRCP